MSMDLFTPARRGMVLVHHEHSSYWVNDAPGRGYAEESDSWTIGIVTSVTRDGCVRRFRPAGWDHERPGPADSRRFSGTVRMVPEVPADAALAVARAHTWPGHPDQPMPFSSLTEVREALRPHIKRERS